MSTATQQAFQQLLSNQMEAFAAHMASQFPQLDQERIISMAKDHCSGLNLVEATAKVPKKRGPKKTKATSTPRAAPEAGCRCMARVWKSGSGFDQCTKSRADGDYCKSHGKQAAITETACQVVNGKKSGLFLGRIDQFDADAPSLPPFKDQNGIIRIEWTSEEFVEVLESQREAGLAKNCDCSLGAAGCKWCQKSQGSKPTRKRKTKAKNELDGQLANELEQANASVSNEIMDAVAPTDGVWDAETDNEEPAADPVPEPTKEAEPVDDQVPEPTKVAEPVADPVPEPTKVAEPVADPVPEPTKVAEPVIPSADHGDQEDVVVDDLEALMAGEDNTGDDDELEVEERVHNGVTHYVDPKSNDIWDIEEGEVIGKWVDGAPVINE